MDNPLALFWDCKNNPSLYEMDHKCPCVLALELFDVSGLSWLMHFCGCRPLEME